MTKAQRYERLRRVFKDLQLQEFAQLDQLKRELNKLQNATMNEDRLYRLQALGGAELVTVASVDFKRNLQQQQMVEGQLKRREASWQRRLREELWCSKQLWHLEQAELEREAREMVEQIYERISHRVSEPVLQEESED